MPEICNSIDSVHLIYTNKCNIKCNHCVYSCSPEKKLKLNLEKSLSLLDSFPKFKIKHLGISGGEPLLYLNEVLQIIFKAKKQGLKVTLLSNGFWGSSIEKAEEIVSKLKKAGVTLLRISSDDFHQKFIPQQNIFNILDASRKQNLCVSLSFAFLNDYSQLGFVAKYRDYFNKINSKEELGFIFQPVQPIGRAFKKIPKEKFVSSKRLFKKEKCPLNELAVSYSGKGFACCNVFFDSNPVFMLNGLALDSPEKLFESYQKSPLIFFLRKKGPYFITKLAEKHKLKKIKTIQPGNYVGLCSYCVHNLKQYSRADLTDMLAEEFEKGNY